MSKGDALRPPSALPLAPLGEAPFVTIVIPCLDEEAHVDGVVRGALAQRWRPDRVEVLVVDGRSRDRTREIVEAIAREDRRVTLLDNPARLQSAGMNLAIKRSRGDVIVRMDAHADYAPDYVAASVAALRKTGAANVGGAARPRFSTWFQRALCAALASPLGVGGSAYRDPSREGFVESVWNGAFRREAFEVAGLYDPDAIANEDAELNQRILEAGGTIYLSRDVVVHYYPRSSLGALARQYFAYGRGRARTLARRRRLLSIRPVVPFLAVLAFVVLALGAAALPSLRPPFAAAIVAYAALVALEAARVAWTSSAREAAPPPPGVPGGLALWPAMLAIFPTMHAAHGVGFAVGLVRFARADLDDARLERLPAR